MHRYCIIAHLREYLYYYQHIVCLQSVVIVPRLVPPAIRFRVYRRNMTLARVRRCLHDAAASKRRVGKANN